MSHAHLPRGPLTAIVAEGFFSRLSFGVVSFALPLYAYRLGFGFGQIGALLAANLVVAMVLKVPLGMLADRVGCRRVLLAAIVLRSAVSLLLVFAAAPWQLFAIRGLHGVSIAMRDPATASLIAVHGGTKRVATSFAWYQTAKTFAGSVGKGAAGLLLAMTASNFSLAFLVGFALSALPLWVVFRHVQPDAVPAGGAGVPPPAAAADVEPLDLGAETPAAPPAAPVRPPVMAAAVLGLLVSGTAYMMANLFPVLAVEHAGLSESQTGLIFLLAPVVALSGPAFGWLSDRSSHRLVLGIRSVANIASSVLYLAVPSFGGFAAAKLADDAGKAAFKPAWGALMAKVAALDPRRRARTMSAVSLGEDAGEVIGPILAGLLWSTWGVAALFGVRIVLAVVTEVYAAGLERRLGLGTRQPALGARAEPCRPGPGRLVLREARLDGRGGACSKVVEPGEVVDLEVADAEVAARALRGHGSDGEVLLDGRPLAGVRGGVVASVRPSSLPPTATVAAALRRHAAPPEAVARAWALSGSRAHLGRLEHWDALPIAELTDEQRSHVALAAELTLDPSLVVLVPEPGTAPATTVYDALRDYPGAAVVLRDGRARRQPRHPGQPVPAPPAAASVAVDACPLTPA